MTVLFLGGLAVLVTAGPLALVARVRSRRRGGPAAGFRRGPLLAWCPAEGRVTAHALDAGGRRCLCGAAAPTPETKTSEETTHGRR